MVTLVGVFSCWRDRWQEDTIRESWLKDLAQFGIEYRFFLGRGGDGNLASDEVPLEVGDSYTDLTFKLRAMCQFAFDQKAERMFKVDLDTFVSAKRLAFVNPFNAGLIGCFTARYPVARVVPYTPNHRGHCDYPCGGAGTWYSRRALEILAAADEDGYGGASDEWSGHKLGGKVPFWHDPRYLYRGYHLGTQDIAVHLSQGTGNYHPEWMVKAKEASL